MDSDKFKVLRDLSERVVRDARALDSGNPNVDEEATLRRICSTCEAIRAEVKRFMQPAVTE